MDLNVLSMSESLAILETKNQHYSKSDLIHNSNYRFYKYYHDSNKFDELSFKSKYSFLAELFNDLNKFNKLKTQKEKKKKKGNVYDTVSQFYNELLGTYFDEYYDLSDTEGKKIEHKYKPKKLFLE